MVGVIISKISINLPARRDNSNVFWESYEYRLKEIFVKKFSRKFQEIFCYRNLQIFLKIS